MSALELEEEHLRRNFDSFRERLRAHITEVRKYQLFLKSNLEKFIVQQKNLDKARADLQKLRRISCLNV